MTEQHLSHVWIIAVFGRNMAVLMTNTSQLWWWLKMKKDAFDGESDIDSDGTCNVPEIVVLLNLVCSLIMTTLYIYF